MPHYIKGQEFLPIDYWNNTQVCANPIELSMGEECYVIDQTIVDADNGTHMFVPCVVIRIDISEKIQGRKYYMLQAKDSVNDDRFNTMEENGVKFYKYLENTSPFLFKVNEIITTTEDNNK